MIKDDGADRFDVLKRMMDVSDLGEARLHAHASCKRQIKAKNVDKFNEYTVEIKDWQVVLLH